MQPPFLRALRSTKYQGTPLAPYVAQPNIVTGLPAQCKIVLKVYLFCFYLIVSTYMYMYIQLFHPLNGI